jgi:hypothetical protein
MTTEERPEKVEVDIDGRSYDVYLIGVVYSRPEEGQPFTIDFRVTGGLVPHGEAEYVRFSSEEGGEIFIVEPSGRCIPCDTQRAKGSEGLQVLAARHVDGKRKETKP